MEPPKFDKQIQETLESRRLQPSNDAWEKLSNRLNNQGKKQNNKAFWYLGIAASVVGLLILAVPFYNTKPVEPSVVNSPILKQEDNTQIAIEPKETSKTILEEIISTKQNEPTNPTLINTKKSVIIYEDYSISNTKNNTSTNIIEQNKLTFEEQKIQEIVAQVQDLKSKNQTISDADIDALLLEAQVEIRQKQLFDSNTGFVDATILLQDVETDLDQSFRSKVFDAIKASFNTVKTVVAQRNN